MKILFALILHSYVYYGGVWARVGVYESWSQCQHQGAALVEKGRSWEEAAFVCVPVNG